MSPVVGKCSREKRKKVDANGSDQDHESQNHSHKPSTVSEPRGTKRRYNGRAVTAASEPRKIIKTTQIPPAKRTYKKRSKRKRKKKADCFSDEDSDLDDDNDIDVNNLNLDEDDYDTDEDVSEGDEVNETMEGLVTNLDLTVVRKTGTTEEHCAAVEAEFGDKLDRCLFSRGSKKPRWNALIRAICFMLGHVTGSRCQTDSVQGWIHYELTCRLKSKPGQMRSHINHLFVPDHLCMFLSKMKRDPKCHRQQFRINRCLVVCVFATMYNAKERHRLMKVLPDFVFAEIEDFASSSSSPPASIGATRYALLTLIILCADTMVNPSGPCNYALKNRRFLFGTKHSAREAIECIAKRNLDDCIRCEEPLDSAPATRLRLRGHAQDVHHFADILWNMDFAKPNNLFLYYPLNCYPVFQVPKGVRNISHESWLFGGHFGWTTYQMLDAQMDEKRNYYFEVRFNTLGSIRVGIAERHEAIREKTGDITLDRLNYFTMIDLYENKWWMGSKHIENQQLTPNEVQVQEGGAAAHDEEGNRSKEDLTESDVLGFNICHLDLKTRIFTITLYGADGLKRLYTYHESNYDRHSHFKKYLTVSVGACQHAQVSFRRSEWKHYADPDVAEFQIPRLYKRPVSNNGDDDDDYDDYLDEQDPLTNELSNSESMLDSLERDSTDSEQNQQQPHLYRAGRSSSTVVATTTKQKQTAVNNNEDNEATLSSDSSTDQQHQMTLAFGGGDLFKGPFASPVPQAASPTMQ